ncbi:uncharacterized protein TNCV_2885581 [Trichonephila clavipes]|nr:uncharacterized protein TNCV_2885581 [Trichonephila clavipes]
MKESSAKVQQVLPLKVAAWAIVVFLVNIETPDGIIDIKIRNNNCYSVFKSELIVIYNGLQFVDTASDHVFRGIWILTDSRASMQHLSRWTTVGDMASLNIMDLVAQLSSRHSIYFEWVPSDIGLNGNDIADCLDKSAIIMMGRLIPSAGLYY